MLSFSIPRHGVPGVLGKSPLSSGPAQPRRGVSDPPPQHLRREQARGRAGVLGRWRACEAREGQWQDSGWHPVPLPQICNHLRTRPRWVTLVFEESACAGLGERAPPPTCSPPFTPTSLRTGGLAATSVSAVITGEEPQLRDRLPVPQQVWELLLQLGPWPVSPRCPPPEAQQIP